MNDLQALTDLAQKSADLLPEPPQRLGIDAYLAWENLVLATASRLGAIAGSLMPELLGLCAVRSRVEPARSWQDLVRLAAMFTTAADGSSTEGAVIPIASGRRSSSVKSYLSERAQAVTCAGRGNPIAAF